MNRAQVYERVSAGILERLESGVAPWHQPWDPVHGRPRNFVSGRPYSGVNAFALGLAGRSPYWLTLNQANRMGFRLRKGSKGVPVLFYTRREVEEPGRDADGKPVVVVRAVSLVRVYWVFNVLDVDGLQLPAPEARPLQGIAAAEAMVTSIRPAPVIVHGSSRAAFLPGRDVIELPAPQAFESAEAYCSTRFHELTHWTGHPSRLNRATLRDAKVFGDSSYSQEELVAEIGAGFLCALAGIENRTIEASASYLATWLKALRADPAMLIHAAAAAQRSVDFLIPAAPAPEGAVVADEAEVSA